MSVILVQDAVVHYEALGRGRPVMLLHTWGGSWRYWLSTMQAVSAGYRVYALDLWGFGDSAKEVERYTLDGQSRLVEAFLNELGIARTALVGHGLGALAALRFAMRSPGQVERVMVVGLPGASAALTRLAGEPPLTLPDWLLGRPAQADAALIEGGKADRRAIEAALAGLGGFNLLAAAETLPGAGLLVSGQNDPLDNPPALGERLSLCPERLHHIIFDGAAHYPMLEEPAQFQRLLSDFLALPSGTSPRGLALKEEWKRRVR